MKQLLSIDFDCRRQVVPSKFQWPKKVARHFTKQLSGSESIYDIDDIYEGAIFGWKIKVETHSRQDSLPKLH